MEAQLNCQFLTSLNYIPVNHILKKGCGFTNSHHGELIQGIFYNTRTKSYDYGLISVPCNYYNSWATFCPSRDKRVYYPNGKKKAFQAVKKTLEYIGKNEFGGELILISNIPEKYGCGSSTADVVATIKSVADAFGHNLSPPEIANLAVQIETASDPIMFENKMILFAQRKGVVLNHFESTIPSFEVLGFNTDEKGIDTLSLKPIQYTFSEICEFQDMVSLVHTAVATQDPKYLGIAAYKSALISQKYLPKPFFDEFAQIVEDGLSLGMQVSHSGTVVGFIFDAKEDYIKKQNKISKIKERLIQLGIQKTWQFSVSNN